MAGNLIWNLYFYAHRQSNTPKKCNKAHIKRIKKYYKKWVKLVLLSREN